MPRSSKPLSRVTSVDPATGRGQNARLIGTVSDGAKTFAICERITERSRAPRCLVPVEVRPDVGAFVAAGLAYEPRFKIREPNVVGPLVCADRDRVAAMIVRAINQDPAHASGAHFPKC